jgi:hypothetical protein
MSQVLRLDASNLQLPSVRRENAAKTHHPTPARLARRTKERSFGGPRGSMVREFARDGELILFPRLVGAWKYTNLSLQGHSPGSLSRISLQGLSLAVSNS